MSINKLASFISFKNYLDLGHKLFLLGVFFLPSALPIGAFLLLISLIIAFTFKKEKILKDKWNYPICLSIFLMFFNSLYAFLRIDYDPVLEINKNIIWLNLFNWIPILIFYLGFQIYLINIKQRHLFSIFLISGTFPVIISCIIQKFFNINGPFETLFGTIVWFNRSLNDAGHTGLFNNSNYLGIWLTLCLPFSLSFLKNKDELITHRLTLIFINIFLVYFSILSSSRNALLGVIISFLFIFGIKKSIKFCLLFLLGIFIIYLLLPLFSLINEVNFENIIQIGAIKKILNYNVGVNYPRLIIWKSTLSFIFQKPIFGWGAGTFTNVFTNKGHVIIPYLNIKSNHSHNIFLELAYNFGIPLSLILSTTFLSLYKRAFNNIKKFQIKLNHNYVDKAWLVSLTIIFVSHLSDLTFYDGKISIIFAALFAGLKNISNENNLESKSLKLP